jgi:hypothetical protein
MILLSGVVLNRATTPTPFLPPPLLRHGPKVRDITVIIPPGPVMDGFLEAFVTVFGQLHN